MVDQPEPETRFAALKKSADERDPAFGDALDLTDILLHASEILLDHRFNFPRLTGAERAASVIALAGILQAERARQIEVRRNPGPQPLRLRINDLGAPRLPSLDETTQARNW
jgi:hypothetical protein